MEEQEFPEYNPGMKYLVFDTEAEALAVEQAIWQGMAPQTPDAERVTQRWAIPQQIADGRWVFPCPCDGNPEAVEAGDDWWPQEYPL
jgi:hypothetical protein